jgi:hypothetical protein
MRLKRIIKWFLYSFIGSEIISGVHMYLELIGYSISKWTLKMLSGFIGVPWYWGVMIGIIGLAILHFWGNAQKKKGVRTLTNISEISEQINELKDMSREALEIHKKNNHRIAKSYEILLNQFCSYMIALDKRLPALG